VTLTQADSQNVEKAYLPLASSKLTYNSQVVIQSTKSPEIIKLEDNASEEQNSFP
jgi:hypothetical protein